MSRKPPEGVKRSHHGVALPQWRGEFREPCLASQSSALHCNYTPLGHNWRAIALASRPTPVTEGLP